LRAVTAPSPLLVRAAPRLRRAAYPAAVAATLAVLGGLLLWNAFHYDWLRSYDAYAAERYAFFLHEEQRLPVEWESDVWHNPPLFYYVAGHLQELADQTGWFDERHRPVQLLSAVAALAVAAFAWLAARELFPRSRGAQIGALVLAAMTPVLVRSGTMYHPEPLAAALTAGALYVVVRALVRDRPTLVAGGLAGLLVGLANLTRTWALAALAALLLAVGLRAVLRRERASALMAGMLAVVSLALVVPWLAVKWQRHGSPFAYSQPVAEQWQGVGRPGDFYVGLAPGDVFTHPYQPRFRNQLLPVVYADWWGDYWRNYRLPPELANEPERLPDDYHWPLVRQAWLGILPTILVLAGLAGLAVRALRTRSYALLAVLASVGLLALSFFGFLIRYPKLDGDNIKALYLLNAVAPVSIAAGWALSRVAAAGRLVFASLVVVLAGAAYLDLAYLILPA
jgi:4-amino-4-deoxy-L-arabinose transferase-like glycosyltransferase